MKKTWVEMNNGEIMTKTTKTTKSWAAGTAMAVRSVLAGAYRGRTDETRAMVTHAVLVDADGSETEASTICRRVKVERLADMFSEENPVAAPTCPECAKRAAR